MTSVPEDDKNGDYFYLESEHCVAYDGNGPLDLGQ